MSSAEYDKISSLPTVSVIIPVYNNPDGLRDTLKSLVSQEFPPKSFEIIVVDNDSTDNTLNIAKEFAGKYPHLIQFLVEDRLQSSYAARNKGIEVSKGDILCFIDADMTVEPDYLSQIDNFFKKESVDYLGCKVNMYSIKDTLSSKYNIATGFPIKNYLENHHFVATCCLSVKKMVIDKVGSFDSRFKSSGDYEFGNRVYRAGFKLCYAPNIIMKHPALSSFKHLIRKNFRIGRGFQQISFYYPENYNKMHRNILNPIYYLPALPWNFSNSMRGTKIWDKASFGQKIKFYLISWLADGLVKQIGYVYESFRKK